MNRRFFILGKFNTWYDWRCTVTAKEIPDAEPKTNYIEIEGAHGALDLSEALAGEPVYSDRVLTASFMCSEGSHKEREALLRQIVTALHGRKIQIIEPDDPEHYYLGRVQIVEKVNHLAYLEFTIEAICDPWRYALNATTRTVVVENEGTADVVIRNAGAKTLRPTIEVVGRVTLTCNGVTTTLGVGSYEMNTFKLVQGVNVIKIEGTGTVTFIYREADL